MNFRLWALLPGIVFSLMVGGVHAQAVHQADYIVVVVNSEPITNQEIRGRVQSAEKELASQHRPIPSSAELRAQMLDRLINEHAQLQLARQTGIRADDTTVDQAEQNVASQNQMDVVGLHKQLAKDGIDVTQFRNQLRDQILLSRLHERDVQAGIRVSDADVDAYLADMQANNADPFTREINLAQILVSVPEKASAEQTAALQQQAQKILARVRGGEDFAAVVRELSAGSRTNGGQLGLRRADRYPPSFVLATQKLGVGEISDIVRSGAGFHILKVIEKRAPAVATLTVVQSHARHILLRTSEQLTQAAALARLADYKKRIQAGTATFAALAREYSQDGSAAQGGDLGWANPGTFVPEFEEVLNHLNEGQIAEPMVSRFGVHLIELVERRRVDLSPQEARESVRNHLRQVRYEDAYALWAQDVRARAFVDFREAPQ